MLFLLFILLGNIDLARDLEESVIDADIQVNLADRDFRFDLAVAESGELEWDLELFDAAVVAENSDDSLLGRHIECFQPHHNIT